MDGQKINLDPDLYDVVTAMDEHSEAGLGGRGIIRASVLIAARLFEAAKRGDKAAQAILAESFDDVLAYSESVNETRKLKIAEAKIGNTYRADAAARRKAAPSKAGASAVRSTKTEAGRAHNAVKKVDAEKKAK